MSRFLTQSIGNCKPLPGKLQLDASLGGCRCRILSCGRIRLPAILRSKHLRPSVAPTGVIAKLPSARFSPTNEKSGTRPHRTFRVHHFLVRGCRQAKVARALLLGTVSLFAALVWRSDDNENPASIPFTEFPRGSRLVSQLLS